MFYCFRCFCSLPVSRRRASRSWYKRTRNGSEPAESVDPASADPGFVKSDKHYTFDYVSDNGRLTIHADADVYLPVRGAISMARIKQVNFTDEFMKKAFDVAFDGETAYVPNTQTYVPSKKEIAEDIAYYQELVDTGRTDEKLLTEEEALTLIEELKDQFQDAPDEPYTIDAPIADGTVQTREYHNGLGNVISREVLAYNDNTSLQISSQSSEDGMPLYGWYTHEIGPDDSRVGVGGSEEGFYLSGWYSPNIAYRISSSDTELRYGQSFSAADAVEQCKAYMDALGVTDVMPFRDCTVFIASSGDQVKAMYYLDFVRTAAGSPVALVPIIQCEDGYDMYEIPWRYETIQFLVDDTGVRTCQWFERVEPTEIISTDVQTISYEEAIKIFENMSVITYEGKTKTDDGVYVYYDLYADQIELSLLRIREQNAPDKSGLYVPAWIFYGERVKQYNEHMDISPDGYLTTILFAINADDGSIIDLSKGY